MSDKMNERLEREARESLVAADLSAKMKQWRDQPPPPGGRNRLLPLLLLLALGGAAWWLWPKTKDQAPLRIDAPFEQPAPVPAPVPAVPEKEQPSPMAQKPAGKQYLAMAQSTYKAPNFANDIRGNESGGQNFLNDARQALADQHPSDALDALQQVPSNYQTDADYLRAHALFQLKKYAAAAAIFEHLNSSIRYGDAAQWYGTLALLPGFEQHKTEIKTRLTTIANDPGHTFQVEAQQLVSGL